MAAHAHPPARKKKTTSPSIVDAAVLIDEITVRDYVKELLSERDVRYEQRFQAQEEHGRLALTAQKDATTLAENNSQRWRDSANEWRAAMTDREAEFMPRREALTMADRFTEQVSTQNERISEHEKPNYPVLLGGFAVFLTLVSGAFYIIQLSTATTVAPVAAAAQVGTQERDLMQQRLLLLERKLSRQTGVLAQQNASTERISGHYLSLQRQLQNNYSQLARLEVRTEANSARTSQQLTEVETQFRATGHLTNLENSWQQRMNSLLWRKVYSAPYPDTEFFPNMAQPPRN